MFLAFFVALVSLALASPLLQQRQGITALSTAQISRYNPYTHYASTAYCKPQTTLVWSCGKNCQANANFQPVASGGDGDVIQYWYVGFDPRLKTVIVAHQGRDSSRLLPLITIADVFFDQLDPELFPGISSSIEVHNGFAEAHARAAPQVLAAVKLAMEKFSTKHITLIGHSLGGAIALIDAIYLRLNLPKDIIFKTVTFGMPRVGNQAFVDYIDSHFPDLTRITNKLDPVPIMPGRFLGFRHTKGEIHISDDGAGWMDCPGQDNTAVGCTVQDVRNILVSRAKDHSGPYNGITIGC